MLLESKDNPIKYKKLFSDLLLLHWGIVYLLQKNEVNCYSFISAKDALTNTFVYFNDIRQKNNYYVWII